MNRNKIIRYARGFTMIELMVVISIIALLSSIILAALSKTEASGRNGKIQSEVISLRDQIELSYSNGTYADIQGGSTSGLNTHAPVAYYAASTLGTSAAAIAADILAQNPSASYGGGVYPPPNSPAGTLYNINGSTSYTTTYATVNGLTIFTDNGNTAGNFGSKYAIYAAYGPNVGTSGYYCVDSFGNSISKTTGYIPAIAPITTTGCQ